MTTNKRYYGYTVRQRDSVNSPIFFVFSVRAKDLLKWAGFKRVEKFSDGTQRIFRETRLESIAKFIKSSQDNTIPNNVLIAFDRDQDNPVKFTSLSPEILASMGENTDNGCADQLVWGHIDFNYNTEIETDLEKEHLKPALVIDGQHRLLGISRQEENLPVLVVAILDCPPAEQAFQFIVINNKSVKVPTQNVKGIISDFGAIEGSLGERLLKAGVPFGKKSPLLHEVDNGDESPFRNLLDWPANRDGQKLVPLTAIESCLSLYKNTFSKIKDDEDSQREILFSIFNAVKEKYGAAIWGKSKNYLMKKVSLNALNELFVERFKFMIEYRTLDLFDPESIKNRTTDIISKVPSEFWTSPWSIIEDKEEPLKVQDNANVRGLIKRDLEQIIDNVNNENEWFVKLRLFKPSNEIIAQEEDN